VPDAPRPPRGEASTSAGAEPTARTKRRDGLAARDAARLSRLLDRAEYERNQTDDEHDWEDDWESDSSQSYT
jgi:hypothetical protein